MRLINTETGEFEEFADPKNTPPYAILSHTWDQPPKREQSYQDVVKIQEKYRPQDCPLEETPGPATSRPATPGAILEPSSASMEELPPTPSSYAPLLPQESPRSRSIFRRRLRMPPRCARVFSLIRLATSWLCCWEPLPSDAAASPDPVQPSDDVQAPPVPHAANRSIWDLDSGLSEKVRKACQIARRDGYRYIWIDSCCIDKTSSSELSEAINSMFNWYRAAKVCYAFLVDVLSEEDVRAPGSSFQGSRWFRRGWTLQELVAPRVVVLLSQDWKTIGTKDGLADVIQEITSIDHGILTHERLLSDESVADRMRWASMRKTTRIEDEAYSLLGIFGITMPTLYGEGEYAFRRLQEEILQRIPDQSLFAWGSGCVPFPQDPCEMSVTVKSTGMPGESHSNPTLFAPSPRYFGSSDRIVRATEDSNSTQSLELPVEEYTHTPYGIRTRFCLLPLDALNKDLRIRVLDGDIDAPCYLVVLRSRLENNPLALLGRLCYLQRAHGANVDVLYLASGSTGPATFTLLLDDLVRVRKTTNQLPTEPVYLPHPGPSMTIPRQVWEKPDPFPVNQKLRLTFPVWAQTALQASGYAISNVQGSTEHDHNSFSFTLVHARSFNIHIRYRGSVHPTRLHDSRAVIIQALAWILSPSDESLHTAAIRSSLPSFSTTWIDNSKVKITVPSQRLILTQRSGYYNSDEVPLRLGLDLMAPGRYNLRVDVAPHINTYVRAPISPPSASEAQGIQRDRLELELPSQYKTLALILPGTARRALETKGYSVHLALEPGLGNASTPSHSLTLTSYGTRSGNFAIVIKYFQVHGLLNGAGILARSDLNLDIESMSSDSKLEEFTIVARITLEDFENRSKASDNHFAASEDHSKAALLDDGPHVVAWYDHSLWKHSLKEKDVTFTTPTGDLLTIHLGLDLAWCYEYYLKVDIMPSIRPPAPELASTLPSGHYHEFPYYLPSWAHQNITLTLPSRVRRALQAQGYNVRFQNPASVDVPDHRLTLTHIHAGFVIEIKYPYRMETHCPEPGAHGEVEDRYPLLLADPQPESDSSSPAKTAVKRSCRQELAFQASVQTFKLSLNLGATPVQSVAATPTSSVAVDWDKWDVRYGYTEHCWQRDLRRKDITLALPNGRQLVLRLSFNLVWYSEYCLTVEINPRTPLSLWDLGHPININTPLAPMPDYEKGDGGVEYIRKALSHHDSTEPEQTVEAHEELIPACAATDTAAEDSLARSRSQESAKTGGERGAPEIYEFRP